MKQGETALPAWGMGRRGQNSSAPAATASVPGPSRLAPVAAASLLPAVSHGEAQPLIRLWPCKAQILL